MANVEMIMLMLISLKQKKRLYTANKLKESGDLVGYERLSEVIEETKVSKPSLHHIQPELDSRFIKIDYWPGKFFRIFFFSFLFAFCN